MIFKDEQEIIQILKDNPAKPLLEAARKAASIRAMYITGEGQMDGMEHFEELERNEQWTLRKRLTRSTKDLFQWLLGDTEKVFTAKGGSKNFFLSKTQEEEFKAYLSKIRNGMSLDEWCQNVAFKAYLIDPMGLTMDEIDEKGNPYPTYKSTSVIFDYLLSGRQPEYLILILSQGEINKLVAARIIPQPEKGQTVYRVIDDAAERFVIKQSQDQFSFPARFVNYFGKVPALTASDITTFNSELKQSLVDNVMELAAEFFNDNSTLALFKKFTMHPKEWGPELPCPVCKGEKEFDGQTCYNCNGKGQIAQLMPSQRLTYSVIEDANGNAKANIPTPPMGYVVPPIDSYHMIKSELFGLKSDMNDTFWGNGKLKQTAGPNVKDESSIDTATGEVLNERSKEPKLKKISKWKESMYKFHADNCKRIKYGPNVKESAIIAGDRYLLESPDELTNKYEKMRTAGAPIPMLDSTLLDVYEARYATNPKQYQKHKLLMSVEPFVHFSIDKVLSWDIDFSLKMQKLYFGEWVATLDDMEIISKSVADLKVLLAAYVEEKAIEEPEPEKPEPIGFNR